MYDELEARFKEFELIISRIGADLLTRPKGFQSVAACPSRFNALQKAKLSVKLTGAATMTIRFTNDTPEEIVSPQTLIAERAHTY